jgi:parvulin-like peptidyl-prolyl isomerase
MRRTSLFFCAFLLLPLPGVGQEDFEVVLRVNDRIATTWDYQRRRAEKMQMIQAAESLPVERRQRMLANVGVSTMDDLFEEMLMLSRADQLGIRVTEADLDRGVTSTRQNNGIETDEQFEQALRASGMTLEQFRENLSRTMLVQKLMGQEVHPRVSLEEEDLRRYYQNHTDEFLVPEKVHLEEVVIPTAGGQVDAATNEIAETIRQQVQAGASLEEVVEPLAAAGTTSNAVDLGWVETGDLDPELEQAVWGLQQGEISEPVVGRGGLHVLLVTERQEAHLMEFSEVAQQIQAKEGERLLGSEMQKYLEELETAAYVVVNPPPDAVGFRASLQMTSDTDELERALTAPLITEPILESEPAIEVVPDDNILIDPDKPPTP